MIKDLSLKLRILCLISAVLLFGMLLAGGIILHNAREAVKAEMLSSTELARHLVNRLLNQSSTSSLHAVAGEIHAILNKQRHVRLIPLAVQHRDRVADTERQIPDVPVWFIRLMHPQQPNRHEISIPGDPGQIVIEADPADEIREVWEDVRQLSVLGTGVFFLVGALLHLTLWYGLRPLDNLQVAFGRLEAGDFGVRLNEEEVAEIARINGKFNQLAKVLEQSKADNRLLTTKLINMQEEERRQIARELHDEMAPLLFNVQVHTSSVTQVLGNAQKEISASLQSINDTASKLQESVRLLLRQLRPIELDGLSLEDALKDLIDSWRRKGLSIQYKLEGFDQVDALAEPVKINVYRILQECLTNIARHANAESVTAYVGLLAKDQGGLAQAKEKITREPIIRVCVEDDGQGIPEGAPLGLGLVGMRERVEALSGWLELSNNDSKDKHGLRVEATIPLTREALQSVASKPRCAKPRSESRDISDR